MSFAFSAQEARLIALSQHLTPVFEEIKARASCGQYSVLIRRKLSSKKRVALIALGYTVQVNDDSTLILW